MAEMNGAMVFSLVAIAVGVGVGVGIPTIQKARAAISLFSSF
jgi:hypothetical protein